MALVNHLQGRYRNIRMLKFTQMNLFIFIRERLLANSRIYSFLMNFLDKGSAKEHLVKMIDADPGCKILDIGCGPASILNHLNDVQYSGIDISDKYIKTARQTFGSKGTFYCVSVDDFPTFSDTKFDRILLIGVLHHLTDAQISNMFPSIIKLLAPGGKIISLDGVFIKRQNPVARLLLMMDRGKNVRYEEGYLKLLQPFVEISNTLIRRNLLRLPYSHLFIEACRASH